MLRPWRCVLQRPPPATRLQRGIADLRPFREGDLVLLRNKNDRSASPILSRALKPGRRIDSHRGVIRHDDIIGKSVRDVVSPLPKKVRPGEDANGAGKGREGPEYRLYEVKLDEYVRLTRRLVTPIYPADARLIVDLLDLHPRAFLAHDDTADGHLHILEAGTGHGALTLYLARAVCGANQPFPSPAMSDAPDEHDEAVVQWKRRRRAVVHTIDISEKYSEHAKGIVQGFKNGLYYPHVDFHVGDVAEWAASALHASESAPFLSHAFLDLPNADHKLEAVSKALRVDGTLVMFNPSITQIIDAVRRIQQEGLPLELEMTVELGVNGGSGGRLWDVRPVRPRAAQKIAQEADVGSEDEGELAIDRDEEQVHSNTSKSDSTNGLSMVCRPRVGDRVVGGGFLGVFKKQRQYNDKS